jgi:hypothetical protein
LARACSRRENIRNAYKMLAGKPEREDHFRDIEVDGRILLKWI